MSLTIGVDVGGTKVAAGVVDDHGAILERVREASPSDDADALRAVIERAVAALREHHEVTAVGVGAAGFVSSSRRDVLFAPNLKWGEEPVSDVLEASLRLPVVVENDGNAAAWAERRFGAGQGVPDQLMVALGTGVGGGLVLEDRLYRGGHGVAAEIGHLNLYPGGRPCKCGRTGCLEQYASGTALQGDARRAAAAGEAPGLLEAAGGDPEAVTGALVTRLARAGDADALRLFAQLADWLGTGIASLVAVLDPRLVLIGGGVSEAGEILLGPLADVVDRELTGRGHRPGPELRTAALGNDAGLIGAADLARHR
jgi:glucokinase